ncbi:MAG: hypothetical protein QXX95_06465 [Nitrososphaerales archaeon]
MEKIIPKLKKETVFYDSEYNLKVNPFDLKDPRLTLSILKETIFMGMDKLTFDKVICDQFDSE